MSEKSSAPTKRSWASVAAWFLVVALCTAGDLGSKHWAIENLSRARFTPNAHVCQPDETGYVAPARIGTAPKVVVRDFFELRYAENCGAAFGLLNQTASIGRTILFYVAAGLASLAMALWFRSGKGGRWFALASVTITAGALGNLSDRIRLGYVVDFIRFFRGAFEYPTFNVADVWITVGVVAMLIDEYVEWKQEKARKSETAADAVAPVAAAEVAPSVPSPDDVITDEASALATAPEAAPETSDLAPTTEAGALTVTESPGT